MELRAGELQAPQAGLYYIYAQTYFRLSSSEEADGEAEEAAQLVQYIYKKVTISDRGRQRFFSPLWKNTELALLRCFDALPKNTLLSHVHLENRQSFCPRPLNGK